MTTTPTGKPQRIRRERTRGWRLPEGAVIVDRTSRWGNPYKIGVERRGYRAARDRAHAVELYERLVAASPTFVQSVREELGGRDLACTCPLDGQPCHADVLLRIAAGEDVTSAAAVPTIPAREATA